MGLSNVLIVALDLFTYVCVPLPQPCKGASSSRLGYHSFSARTRADQGAPQQAAYFNVRCWSLHLGRVCPRLPSPVHMGDMSEQEDVRMGEGHSLILVPAAGGSCDTFEEWHKYTRNVFFKRKNSCIEGE